MPQKDPMIRDREKWKIPVLDHGYIRFIEAWGHGDAGVTQYDCPHVDGNGGTTVFHPSDFECGIIEAARQSTQASFRGWEDKKCESCWGTGSKMHSEGSSMPFKCPECEGKGYLPGDKRLLAFLFNGKPQHATPFEFAGMVIEVQAPIFVFREWHRHRTQSYNEMSARYAPLPDLNYVPTKERCMMNSTKNKQAGRIKGADDLNEPDATEFQLDLKARYDTDESFYQKWLNRGVPKELARVKLPVGRYSKMRACANLRNWLAFMTLRADPNAQWEIQQYAEALGTILVECFPRTWNLFSEAKKNAPKPLREYTEEEFRAEAIRRGILMKPFPDVTNLK